MKKKYEKIKIWDILKIIGVIAIIVIAVVIAKIIFIAIEYNSSYFETITMRNQILNDTRTTFCENHNAIFMNEYFYEGRSCPQCVSFVNDTIMRRCINSPNMAGGDYDKVYFTGEIDNDY